MSEFHGQGTKMRLVPFPGEMAFIVRSVCPFLAGIHRIEFGNHIFPYQEENNRWHSPGFSVGLALGSGVAAAAEIIKYLG